MIKDVFQKEKEREEELAREHEEMKKRAAIEAKRAMRVRIICYC